ncbi:hypothetical protein BGZ95_005687 [Linnemannia exigua]|uniref:Kelch repeat-containing protein n=1 Tax=Linnemannia exigua TaxID=604196 RepID=A0AAD4D1N8_9FUNG|nr:hypothetical protein BGZ95_005687 [Linnemannia exigua]
MTILNFNTCSRCVYPSRVLLFLVASLLLFIQPIPAQYTSPAPGKVYMWNYIADKTLFVRQASQFYSLDLTPLLSGNGNLVWKTLSTLNGPVPELELYQPIGITADSQAVISFNPSGTVSAYALASDTWSPPLALPAGAYIYDNHYVIPMTDPRTGIVYIEVKSNDVIQMLAYDPATKTRTFIPMPLTFRAPYTAYYMTWSYYMDGLVFFDSNPLDTQVKFQIYRPASNSWNYLTWNGTGPNPKYTPSINGCMVSAYNGRKIIIVGGQSGFDTAPGVFIIDAATLTWTEGPPVANGRGGMACATAGDYLVLSGVGEIPFRALSPPTHQG